MMRQPDRLQRIVLASLAIAVCQVLVACGSLGADNTMHYFRDAGMSMQGAQEAMVVGRTTQADAKAILGPATEIQFDSGYTVWAYRMQKARPGADRAEFIILFTPSGVVKKTRLRPAYAPVSE